MTPWRNGSASDSRSEGCVFKSRRGQELPFCVPPYPNWAQNICQDAPIQNFARAGQFKISARHSNTELCRNRSCQNICQVTHTEFCRGRPSQTYRCAVLGGGTPWPVPGRRGRAALSPSPNVQFNRHSRDVTKPVPIMFGVCDMSRHVVPFPSTENVSEFVSN